MLAFDEDPLKAERLTKPALMVSNVLTKVIFSFHFSFQDNHVWIVCVYDMKWYESLIPHFKWTVSGENSDSAIHDEPSSKNHLFDNVSLALLYPAIYRDNEFTVCHPLFTYIVLVSSGFIIDILFLLRAWPNVDILDQKWKKIQDPLFEALCSEKIIYTRAGGGRWLKVEEAVFDKLDDNELKELLSRVLLHANENVASMPYHVLKTVGLYAEVRKEINPPFVRNVLKENPFCYRNLRRTEKLKLLKFVLSCEGNRFTELIGLELLPIAGGCFTSFANSDEAIYIASPEHPQELLPGLHHRFLDQEIDVNLFRSLEVVAKKGMEVTL